MIDSGKRLVTFLDNAADFATVPYLIDGIYCNVLNTRVVAHRLLVEFTNVWETAFNVIDPAFDCNVNRTKGDPTTQMYLINHFLDKLFLNQPIPIPDVDKANVTNSASGFGSLGAHVDTCVADRGLPPNFLLVDVSAVSYLSALRFNTSLTSSMSMVEAPSSRWQPLSME